MNEPPTVPVPVIQSLVSAAGEHASYRFFEFFTANIRNPNTRRAYARAAKEFFDWLEARGVTLLTGIESVHERVECVRRCASRGTRRADYSQAPSTCSIP
jgi:hypothetical protein